MKIINTMQNSSVVLTTLKGRLDSNGNIQTICTKDDWSIISENRGVTHHMKTNRYNPMRAKHRFENNTDTDIRFKWAINIVTQNGQNIKYDFGDVFIRAGATAFAISVPYKQSTLVREEVKRIMVALMIV